MTVESALLLELEIFCEKLRDSLLPHLETRAALALRVAELQRELTGLGCSASKSVVGRFVAFLREGEPLYATRSATKHKGNLDDVRRSVRKIARLLATPAARLDDRERQWITDLCHANPEISSMYALIQELRTLLVGGCESCAAQLNAWIARSRTCGTNELQRLGQSLQRDFRAVTAGLSLPWGNAQTEGQVTKLKLIKRQRYGQAGFELLRRCVLLS